MRIGLVEAIVILGLILLVFKIVRVPGYAKFLGRSLKEFKKDTKEIKEIVDVIKK
ncbi:twin-arginine translocase TatA/TatE family subunit [Thermoproteota archaeon]